MNRKSKKYILISFGIISIVTLILGLSVYANNQDKQYIITSGTIRYLTFEGGFYGIAGDDGVNYDPINLPDNFRIDGLKVFLTAIIREGLYSYHMWGIIIEIINIQPI
ncbi:MAG: hypothetical protein ACFFAK_05495 [Promethearchaeota archaeon]